MRYSWGGGNEKGPTLGIHDGGVADSYGDYANPGFDCSGLMMYAYGAVGIHLPHYTGSQYQAEQKYQVGGADMPTSQMQPGDLIYFGPGASEHVAMYIGGGKIVESPQSGEKVHVVPYTHRPGQFAVTRPLAGLPGGGQQQAVVDAATNAP